MTDQSPDATDSQRKGGVTSTFGLGNGRLMETNGPLAIT